MFSSWDADLHRTEFETHGLRNAPDVARKESSADTFIPVGLGAGLGAPSVKTAREQLKVELLGDSDRTVNRMRNSANEDRGFTGA